MLCPRDVKFLISGLYNVRKVIKGTPILQLQSWILEARWFLTHIMDVGYVQEMSCIRFQASLMSGGSSNTLSEYRLCPGDVMFQILGL